MEWVELISSTTIAWHVLLEQFLLGEVDLVFPLTSVFAHWQGIKLIAGEEDEK